MMSSVENLGKAWLDLIKAYKELFFLEFKLARYSFVPFCFMVLLFIVTMGAFWLITLLVTVFLIYHSTHNWLYALIAVEVISALGVTVTFLLLYRYFNQLKFHHLRLQLKNLQAKEVKNG